MTQLTVQASYKDYTGYMVAARRIKRLYVHYILLIAAVIVITFTTTHVSLFEKGLIAAPLLMVVTVAALLGDFLFGALSIIFCAIALNYATTPIGFSFDSASIIKLFEFLVSSVIIFGLIWKIRNLHSINVELSNNVSHLGQQLATLKRQQHRSKGSLKKLKRLNEQLDNLVSEFVQDDRYWEDRLEKDASTTRHYKKYFKKA